MGLLLTNKHHWWGDLFVENGDPIDPNLENRDTGLSGHHQNGNRLLSKLLLPPLNKLGVLLILSQHCVCVCVTV